MSATSFIFVPCDRPTGDEPSTVFAVPPDSIRRPRARSRSPLPWMLVIAAVIGTAGAVGVLSAADDRTKDVERIEGLEEVLASVPDENDEAIEFPAENYLLVGSDTREGVDPNSEDFGVIGDEADVGGRRSDTIMILRQERNGGAAIMSLPRDLYVEIAGTGRSGRINSAYNEGPERLAATVTESLGIPIHHYIEVDFIGFKNIIDRLGGVELCVGFAARDLSSGLALNQGCQQLDGVQALAYARSRRYEEWDGSRWNTDPRADLGRVERQQLFMRAAVDNTLRKLRSSPFGSGDTIDAIVESVKIDDALDPISAAAALRSAAEAGLRTYALPVFPVEIGGAAVLELGRGSSTVLDYFRGNGPAPAEFETGVTTG
jgi:LCP family protein required for cell wall assembly